VDATDVVNCSVVVVVGGDVDVDDVTGATVAVSTTTSGLQAIRTRSTSGIARRRHIPGDYGLDRSDGRVTRCSGKTRNAGCAESWIRSS
jgi:hypothetical protein